MKIYGFPTFNISKVLLTAEFIGLDYEYVALDPGKGEHKTPQHLERHPLGRVPVLEHEGEFVSESAAICRYLARISDSPLYSGDARYLARVDQWMDMTVQHYGRWMGIFFWEEVVKAGLMRQSCDPAALAEAQNFLDQQLPVLEMQLSKNTWIGGDAMSLADIIGAAHVQISEVTSLDLSAYAAITAWYGKLRSSAPYSRAMQHFANRQIFSASGSDADG